MRLAASGRRQNKEKWVIATVEHLFDEMRDGQQGYALFGYSAGAQVAQRLALLRPNNRATVIVVANAGSYTSAEFRKDKGASAFPQSLMGTSATDSDVRAALAKRLVVMLGENDNDPEAIDMGKGDAAKLGSRPRARRKLLQGRDHAGQ